MPADPVERLKSALHLSDAPALRRLFADHTELEARINDPLFDFDSPPITLARTREVLDVLLDAGADINAKSQWWAGGFNLLDAAPPDLAAYAIGRGATITPNAAARLGMLDELRQLVSGNPSLANSRGGDGQTPLHVASTVGVAEFLLDHGAGIDARDIDHESTPAQYLIRDHQDVVRLLVSRGCHTDILMACALGDVDLVRKILDADPDAIRTTVSEEHFPKHNPRAGGHIYIWKLGHNKPPHLVAKEFNHDEVFRLLMERTPDELKLAQACLLGDEKSFNALLAANPELPENLSHADQRKLVDAAQNNNPAAVALMLDAGWPVAAKGQHRATALHWAAFHGNADMARAILRHGPPIEDKGNDFQSTPLGWAVYGSQHGWHAKTGDYAGTVEVLCAAGAALPQNATGTEAVTQVLQRHKRP